MKLDFDSETAALPFFDNRLTDEIDEESIRQYL